MANRERLRGRASTGRAQPARTPRDAHPVVALQALAGNRAVSSAIASVQREEEDGAEGAKDEDVAELVETLLQPKDLGETALELPEWSKTAVGAGEAATGELGVNSTVFGPLGVALGASNLIRGVQSGGEKGAKQAMGGAAGVLGGAAATLEPVLGAVITAPAAAVATGFGLGLTTADAGIAEAKEEGIDLPGAAADIGEALGATFEFDEASNQFVIRHAGTAGGLVGTAAGTVAMAPLAFGFGVKRGAKALFKAAPGVDEAEAMLHPHDIDLPVTETEGGPRGAVAHEEMPRADTWAVPKSAARRPRLERRVLRHAVKQLGSLLAKFAATAKQKKRRR